MEQRSSPTMCLRPDYELLPLKQLAKFIEKEKHLPEIPSAAEINARGVNLSRFQMQLLKKIEELTLYTLRQDETISQQQVTIQGQRQAMQRLQKEISTLWKQQKRLQTQEQTVRQLWNLVEDFTSRLAAVEETQRLRSDARSRP